MSARGTPAAIIVGAGLMGRWHADASSRCGGRVVAAVDPDAEAAAGLAGRFGARAYPELARALDDVGNPTTGPRVVHICTPLGTHVPLGETALEAGCHVLVEKPATPDAEAAERLLEAAEARRLLLAPVHQFLFQPGFLRIVERRVGWGPLRHLIGLACSAGADPPTAPDRGTVAYEIVPHFLSILERLSPEALDRIEWDVLSPRPGEVHLVGKVEEGGASGGSAGDATGNGVVASLTVSMSGRPTRNTVDIIGEHGSAHADLFHGFATFEGPTVSRARKALRPFDHSSRMVLAAASNLARRSLRREPAYPGLRELIRQFYAAALGGGPSPISATETLRVARAHEAIGRLLRRDPAG